MMGFRKVSDVKKVAFFKKKKIPEESKIKYPTQME